jgi:RNA polymerase sigma-70 factor (ECF subfamily)
VNRDAIRELDNSEDTFLRALITHSALVRGYLIGLRAEREDLDDLCQDVWLTALRNRTTFAAHGSLAGWLLRICRTVRARELRRQRKWDRWAAPGNDSTGDSPTVEESLISAETKRELGAALERLTPRQKAVVISRLVDGHSVAETAKAMGCAPGTIKATLHAALARMRPVISRG